MKEREVIKKMLEALEVANSCVDGYYIPKGKTQLPEVEQAITAAEEALAQSEQEPVAFICEFYADEGHPFVSFEPVTHGTNTPLYSTPPQRKPLTDEEIILIVAECAASHQHTDIHFARAIERAHGIKELV